MDTRFQPREYAPESLFDAVTDIRVQSPEIILEEASRRVRRQKIAPDGKLCILACDHPARRVVSSLGDPTGMGDRRGYLSRILRVLTHPEIDGVMATPDIIDDLFIISHLMRERGMESFLDNKVMIGCMNRGGLAGTVFEMDDAMTSYTVESMVAHGFDGAKLMFRLDPGNPDSLKCMVYCSRALNEIYRAGLTAFLEPLAAELSAGGYRIQKDPDEMIKVIGVASAMGESSARLWLKIPMVSDFRRVMRSTTLPVLLLGGESSGRPFEMFRELDDALNAGYGVRGVLIGRNVLYPGDEDPRAVALAISRMVHRGQCADDAADCMPAEQENELDMFSATDWKAGA